MEFLMQNKHALLLLRQQVISLLQRSHGVSCLRPKRFHSFVVGTKAFNVKNSNMLAHSNFINQINRHRNLNRQNTCLHTTHSNAGNSHRYFDSNENATSEEEESLEKRKPIHFYSNKDIRMRKIKQLVRNVSIEDNRPFAEQNETDSQRPGPPVKLAERYTVQTLRKRFFTDEQVIAILFVAPEILALKVGKLEHRFRELEKYFQLPADVLHKICLKCPKLLTLNNQMTNNKVLAIQNLNLMPQLKFNQVVYLIQKCPELMSIKDTEKLKSKVRNFKNLGINSQLLYRLVMKHPQVLIYSEQSVKEKVEYLTQKMNGHVSLCIKFPRVFTCSLDRIKERHNYLLELSYLQANTHMSENKLRAIVLTTETDFIRRVTQSNTKNFRSFQKRYREHLDDYDFRRHSKFGDWVEDGEEGDGMDSEYGESYVDEDDYEEEEYRGGSNSYQDENTEDDAVNDALDNIGKCQNGKYV